MSFDHSALIARYGDPAAWSGDYRAKVGKYHSDQRTIAARLDEHETFIIALGVRSRFLGTIKSKQIAAVFGVSREAVDRRLRARGLKNPAGEVGRPVSRLAALDAADQVSYTLS